MIDDIKKGNKEAIKNNEIFILKMKAIKINDLAEVMIEELAPKYGKNPKKIKIEEIGPRKGEKIRRETSSVALKAYLF